MGLDKCLLSCVHHYRIIRNGFTALKICASAIHPSLSPSEPLVASDLFISIVLPFPDGPIVEIIQCMGFSDCIISWLNNSFPFFFITECYFTVGFPGGSVKNSPANAGDLCSIPGSERSPREGNGNPFQYSCLENHTDRGLWWATVHGVTKSQTRHRERDVVEHLFMHFLTICVSDIYSDALPFFNWVVCSLFVEF